jgi:hypothetical protein
MKIIKKICLTRPSTSNRLNEIPFKPVNISGGGPVNRKISKASGGFLGDSMFSTLKQ